MYTILQMKLLKKKTNIAKTVNFNSKVKLEKTVKNFSNFIILECNDHEKIFYVCSDYVFCTKRQFSKRKLKKILKRINLKICNGKKIFEFYDFAS